MLPSYPTTETLIQEPISATNLIASSVHRSILMTPSQDPTTSAIPSKAHSYADLLMWYMPSYASNAPLLCISDNQTVSMQKKINGHKSDIQKPVGEHFKPLGTHFLTYKLQKNPFKPRLQFSGKKNPLQTQTAMRNCWAGIHMQIWHPEQRSKSGWRK